MRTFIGILDLALAIYIWILLAAAVLFLLTKFKAIDVRSGPFKLINDGLEAVTEPVRRPLRQALPDLGDVDITPVILIAALVLVRYIIAMHVLPVMP
jgi:YggT family protein